MTELDKDKIDAIYAMHGGYQIKRGLDGDYYAVFKNEFDALEYDRLYPDHFEHCDVECFGGVRNAFALGQLH